MDAAMDLANPLFQQAMVLEQAGQIRLLQQAIDFHQAGQLSQAAAAYRDLLVNEPTNPLLYHLLAKLAMAQDNARLVLALADMGIAHQPRFAVLHQDRATALRRLNCKQEALLAIEQALQLDSNQADFYETRAAVLRDLRRYHEALANLKTALTLQPNNDGFYNAAGMCCARMGAVAEALAYFDQFIARQPDKAVGYNNKANTLKLAHRYQEALHGYEQALTLDPTIFMGKANKAMVHLVLGDYATGWPLFEDRRPGNMLPEGTRFPPEKRWQGEALPHDKRLLLYHEQGLGDSVQCIRYLPLVLARAPNLVVQVQPALVTLFAHSWPQIPFISEAEPLPIYEKQCPLMSLPYLFATRRNTIPSPAGYLYAAPKKIAFWRDRLPQNNHRKIGLVWAGNPGHINDHWRSIPLAQFSPLFTLPNTHFIALQQGAAAEQMATLPAPPNLTAPPAPLTDFSDTAALLKNLDLLISVDTAILHTAAALGVPSFALIQFDPDWRWLLEREDSPWYHSIRLFRQKSLGDWQGVIEAVRAALA